jgi:hypothetical protein
MDGFRRRRGRYHDDGDDDDDDDDGVFGIDAATPSSDSSFLVVPDTHRRRPVLRRRASFPPPKTRMKVRLPVRPQGSNPSPLTPLSPKMDPWAVDPPSNVGPRPLADDGSDDMAPPAGLGGCCPLDYEYERGYSRRNSRVVYYHGDAPGWVFAEKHHPRGVLGPAKDGRGEYARSGRYGRDGGGHRHDREYRHTVHFSRRPTPPLASPPLPPPPPPPPVPPAWRSSSSSSRAKKTRRRAAADMIMGVYEVLRSDGLAEREITDFFKDSIIEARRKHG